MSVYQASWLRCVAVLVPRRRRGEWLREWQAELYCLQQDCACRQWMNEMLADAWWLRRELGRGSAVRCMAMLTVAAAVLAFPEWRNAGSITVWFRTLVDHFYRAFIFGCIPGAAVAIAITPRAPRVSKATSTRWTHLRGLAFLAVKFALVLSLGLFGCVAVCGPLRPAMLLSADWLEVFLSAVSMAAALGWTLRDQQQRCRHCLNRLTGPARVGAPSHNLLAWSGLELSCAGGHGVLLVPEMEGSWCWYHRWVQTDSSSPRVGN